MNGRRRAPLGALIVVVMSIAGVACGSTTKSTSPTTAAAASAGATDAPAYPVPSKLTIILSGGLQAAYVPYLAAEKGPLADLLAKKNVQFSRTISASGADAMAALTGGSADMGLVGSARVLAAAAAGEKLIGIFDPFYGSADVLVGAKKYESSIGSNVAGYASKTWAYNSPGGLSAIGMQSVAEAAGLKWASLKQIAYGDSTAGAPTLQSGRADLVAMDPVNAANAVALGLGYVVSNLLDLSSQPAAVTSNTISSGLFVTPSFIRKYPDFVQAIANTMIQSLVKTQTLTSVQVMELMPKDFQDANNVPAVWDAQWKLVLPSITGTDGSFTPTIISETFAGAVQSGSIKAATDDLKSVFDNDFVNKAYQTLKIPRPAVH